MAGNWKNIRIKSKLINQQDLNDQQLFFISKIIIPSAISFFQNLLQVYPLQEPLKVDVKQCLDYQIQQSDQTIGIEDTDYLFYVQGVNDDQQYFANAFHCAFAQDTGRPTVGFVTINMYMFQNLDEAVTKKFWIDILIHEFTHALVFNQDLFAHFVKQDNVISKQNDQYWINASIIVEEGKKYFGCQQLQGLPLENDGNEGSQGQHWETSTFGNELMTAGQEEDQTMILSNITFKLFEASGWYLPDYSVAQPFLWGKNQGCDIANGQCNITTIDHCNPKYNQTVLCSFDYEGISECNTNYIYSPQCGLWRSQYSCNDDTTDGKFVSEKVGGEIGPQSKCWVTNLPQKKGFTINNNIPFNAACYKSTCNNNIPSLVYKDNVYQCSYEGQQISIDNGWIQCPQNFDYFCLADHTCPNQCYKRGKCNNGVCSCFSGYSGEDCSIINN